MSRPQDWSDSEDGQSSADEREGYTSVHLGIPSDRIEDQEDLQDAYVSRIGGTPAFLSYPYPSPDASKCKVCNAPSELLVQMLCNLEENPFERVLYVWGCSKPTCQRKDGAIRAWRALRLDEKYARRLKRKQEKKFQAPSNKEAKAAPVSAASNPFSTNGSNPFSSNALNPFLNDTQNSGFGGQIVGPKPSIPRPTSTPQRAVAQSSSGEDSTDEEEEEDAHDVPGVHTLTKEIEAASLGPSVDWSKQPSYEPIYLETETEYLPPAQKHKSTGKAVLDSNKSGGGDDWGKEMWEDSGNLDGVFVRFTMRLDARPSQCIRYDLGGQPLFYQVESVYRSLHSVPAGTLLPVTGAAFAVGNATSHKSYNPAPSSLLPKCPVCHSSRRFECQLMPNLINKLRRPGLDQNMEWGTCLVFTCAANCSQNQAGAELKDCWREEVVLVQWEV